MIKQKQLFRHDPDNGVIGDCFRTVLACLLDIKPDVFPHFGQTTWGDIPAFQKAYRDYLNLLFKLELVCIAYDGSMTLQEVLDLCSLSYGNAFYMLSGTSRNNVGHVVIAQGNAIYWDTSLDDSGLIGPHKLGAGDQWHVELLISTRFTRKEGQ